MFKFKAIATTMTIIAAGAAAVLMAAAAFAHDGDKMGDYAVIVGFLNEPAYEGAFNAVSLRVTKEVEPEDDHHHGSGQSGGHHHGDSEPEIVPVEGLQDTLQVEVTHVASSVSTTLPLRSYYGEPGHYIADLIPTSPGHYRFRFFGKIEETDVDETYDSWAGGGKFDDVQPASAIQFPEPVPSNRELESAVRGARQAAERAQDVAISAESAAISANDAAISADDGVSNAAMMGIIGIVVGAIGAALGAFALFTATRARNDN